MTYQLLNQDYEEIGRYRSIKQAYESAEQYFQCGIKQDLRQIKRYLRSDGTAVLNHRVANEWKCHIEKTELPVTFLDAFCR